MTNSFRARSGLRIGAGVAALVGLSAFGMGPASAAPGFDPAGDAARVAGADRYATAALVAEQNWAHPDTVIVANGEGNGIDALSASYLAGVVDAPILLTTRDSVPAATEDALKALDPKHVIVVGAAASVSEKTFADLLRTGGTGERIAGEDRYETAEKLLDVALREGAPEPTSVFLARGDQTGSTVAADALAASPVSYRAHVPVLLVRQDSTPKATLAALGALNLKSAYVLGSSAAVAGSVEGQVRAVTKLPTVGRLQGSDRTETAAAIASSSIAKDAGFSNTTVGLANGRTLDALVAGPAAGKNGYPLLLTESATSLGSGAERYLHDNKSTLVAAKVFGGTSSVSAVVVEGARAAAAGTATAGGAPAPVVTQPENPTVTGPTPEQIAAAEQAIRDAAERAALEAAQAAAAQAASEAAAGAAAAQAALEQAVRDAAERAAQEAAEQAIRDAAAQAAASAAAAQEEAVRLAATAAAAQAAQQAAEQLAAEQAAAQLQAHEDALRLAAEQAAAEELAAQEAAAQLAQQAAAAQAAQEAAALAAQQAQMMAAQQMAAQMAAQQALVAQQMAAQMAAAQALAAQQLAAQQLAQQIAIQQAQSAAAQALLNQNPLLIPPFHP